VAVAVAGRADVVDVGCHAAPRMSVRRPRCTDGARRTDAAHGARRTDTAHGARRTDTAHGARRTDTAHGARRTDTAHFLICRDLRLLADPSWRVPGVLPRIPEQRVLAACRPSACD